ncbi:MAG TPA: hypothetical protein VFO03_01825 [Gaiellaceae bacterium]|nr:hypothetical protein [Gaiellaceae bacterium]
MKRLVFSSLLCALLLAGCGGDNDSSSADSWANGVCGDLSTWKDSVKSTAAAFSGGQLSQAQVQDAADEISNATEQLVGDLKDVGTPDTESGQQAKDAVDQLSNELQTDLAQVQRAAAGASGAADTAQAVATIRMAATTMQAQLTTAFQSMQQADDELKSAFEDSENCQKLKSS